MRSSPYDGEKHAGFRRVSAAEAFSLFNLTRMKIYGTHGSTGNTEPAEVGQHWVNIHGQTLKDWSNRKGGNYKVYWVKEEPTSADFYPN